MNKIEAKVFGYLKHEELNTSFVCTQILSRKRMMSSILQSPCFNCPKILPFSVAHSRLLPGAHQLPSPMSLEGVALRSYPRSRLSRICRSSVMLLL